MQSAQPLQGAYRAPVQSAFLTHDQHLRDLLAAERVHQTRRPPSYSSPDDVNAVVRQRDEGCDAQTWARRHGELYQDPSLPKNVNSHPSAVSTSVSRDKNGIRKAKRREWSKAQERESSLLEAFYARESAMNAVSMRHELAIERLQNELNQERKAREKMHAKQRRQSKQTRRLLRKLSAEMNAQQQQQVPLQHQYAWQRIPSHQAPAATENLTWIKALGIVFALTALVMGVAAVYSMFMSRNTNVHLSLRRSPPPAGVCESMSNVQGDDSILRSLTSQVDNEGTANGYCVP